MPSNRVKIIVRCEDRQRRSFIYRFLVAKGINRHDINIENSPGGKGAATQWVLERYPIEVQALRSGPPASEGLISIIDADNCEVEDRKRQHDDALKQAAQRSRMKNEKIAIVVPKRNTETWINHFLRAHGNDAPVNEHDNYPKLSGRESACAPAAEEFARRCPNGLLADHLPSLRDGCAELQRVIA